MALSNESRSCLVLFIGSRHFSGLILKLSVISQNMDMIIMIILMMSRVPLTISRF